MKRFLALLLAVCMFALCGCSSETPEDTVPETQPTTAPTQPAVVQKDVTWRLPAENEKSLTVKVIDKQSKAVLYDRTVPAGEETIQLRLEGTGQRVYELWIDGALAREETVDFSKG